MRNATVYGLTLITLYIFWIVSGRPQTIPEPEVTFEKRLYSVSYSPLERHQSPLDPDKGLNLSEKRIDSDMAMLSQRFSCIRMYSSTGMELIPAYAEKYGIKVFLGVWVNDDPVNTQKELQKAIALAKRHRSIVQAVIVGNETLLRREVTGPQLAAYIRQVKTALPDVPVTYADVWEFWLKHPEVAPAVDFLTIHILPYWEDDPIAIDDAFAHIRNIRNQVVATFPEKEIMIGETGWPSQGRMRESALPSVENQARFIRGFIHLAEQENWRYNLIEAFDQPWKRINEGAVGGYWGLYDPDRVDKNIVSGPVSNFPNWMTLFFVSAVLALLTLPIAAGKHQMSATQLLKYSSGVLAGAILLTMQGNQFSIISRNVLEYIWAVIVLTQTGIIWLITLDVIASGEPLNYLCLDSTIHLIQKKLGIPRAGGKPETAVPEPVIRATVIRFSIARLGVMICMMISVFSLLMDPRYRSFNNAGFVLPAVAFAWLFIRGSRADAPDGLERIIAVVLAAGSIGILVNETPMNIQADIWIGICLLMAWPLWKNNTVSSLRHLVPHGILVAVVYGVFETIRLRFLDSATIHAACLNQPAETLCMFRSILFMMIYDHVYGWASLILTGLALWRNTIWLLVLAMIISLGSMIFHNVDMGTIGLVLSGFVLVHAKTRGFKAGQT